ncbi:MAG: DUF2889 domain-containing protein [Lautropia sp.]
MIDNGIQREEIHHRQIDLRVYRRSDGCIEVVGSLLDRKRQPFRRQLADEDTPPGTPLHDIVVTLVVDTSLVVREASASMPTTPFPICTGAAQTLAVLEGERVGSGWNRRVRELLGGVKSCTHVVELLGPMATALYQGLAPERLALLNQPGNEAMKQRKVDSCFAYSAEREVVARLFPAYRREPEPPTHP